MTAFVKISVDHQVVIELDDGIDDPTQAVDLALMVAAEEFERILHEYIAGNEEFEGLLSVDEYDEES